MLNKAEIDSTHTFQNSELLLKMGHLAEVREHEGTVGGHQPLFPLP